MYKLNREAATRVLREYRKEAGFGTIGLAGKWIPALLVLGFGIMPAFAGGVAGRAQSSATSPDPSDLEALQKKTLADDLNSMTDRLLTLPPRETPKREFTEGIWRP